METAAGQSADQGWVAPDKAQFSATPAFALATGFGWLALEAAHLVEKRCCCETQGSRFGVISVWFSIMASNGLLGHKRHRPFFSG